MTNNSMNKLPDTPWHVGFAKKDADDPRRHKARCIHLKSGNKCGYNSKCIGSSHCGFYAESEHDFEEIMQARLTHEQLTDIAAKEYQTKKMARAKKLMETDPHCFSNRGMSLTICPICQNQLNRGKRIIKKCSYCGAVFSDRENTKFLCFIMKPCGR